MTDCRAFEDALERLIAGELGEDESAELHLHAAECERCCELLDLHQQLEAEGLEIPEPTEFELAAMRRRLWEKIEERETHETQRALDSRISGGERGLAVAAAVVLLLGLGFFAGRSSTPDTWLAELDDAARGSAGLADVQASPYLFSNVRLEPRDDGAVELGFDVVTHLRLERPADDPLVREVVAHSLVNPAPLGTRLAAVKLSARVSESKTHEALVYALREDPSQAVRLAALEALAPSADDPTLRGVLLEVLANDPSVTLRLRAIDALERRGLGGEEIRRAVERTGAPVPPAVRVRAAELARETEL